MRFLVFIEQREGKIRKASLEALSLAAKLAGGPVSAVIAGKGVAALANDLGTYGASVVYVADRDDLSLYSNRGYVGALQAAKEKESPDAVLIAATSMGRDIAPRFAARNSSGVLADVMELREEGGRLVGVRPVYSGKARATVDCGASPLQIATTRPNVFPAEPRSGAAPTGRDARPRLSRDPREGDGHRSLRRKGARRDGSGHRRVGRAGHQGLRKTGP